MSETPDQASTRRRWVSLAEMVAVAGVLIAGMTLWLNWSARRDAATEQARSTAQARESAARLDLRATLSADRQEILLSDPRHELIDTRISFPPALNIPEQTPALPRIAREWFSDAILKATDGGPDAREGRLPVLATVRFMDGDRERSGQVVLEVVWRTQGRLIGGRTLSLEAARVRERGGNTARLDTLWKREAAQF